MPLFCGHLERLIAEVMGKSVSYKVQVLMAPLEKSLKV